MTNKGIISRAWTTDFKEGHQGDKFVLYTSSHINLADNCKEDEMNVQRRQDAN